jgi:hypothetical protein
VSHLLAESASDPQDLLLRSLISQLQRRVLIFTCTNLS